MFACRLARRTKREGWMRGGDSPHVVMIVDVDWSETCESFPVNEIFHINMKYIEEKYIVLYLFHYKEIIF